jgi:hypothetical protein
LNRRASMLNSFIVIWCSIWRRPKQVGRVAVDDYSAEFSGVKSEDLGGAEMCVLGGGRRRVFANHLLTLSGVSFQKYYENDCLAIR